MTGKTVGMENELSIQTNINWLRSIDEIEGLQEDWRNLELEVLNRTPFSSFDWVVSWYHHYSDLYGAPLVGIATVDKEVVGIAPLVDRKSTLGKVPVSSVDFAGFNSEAGEFLVKDGMESLVGLFIGSLVDTQNIDVISLNGFESDSKEFFVVEKVLNDRGLDNEIIEDYFAMVDLSKGYSHYFDSLKSKARNSAKRQKRKITNAGRWEVEHLNDVNSEVEILDGIDRIISIYNNSWKAIENGEFGERHREFYKEVAGRFSKRGMIGLHFLRFENRDIAFILWLVDGNCYYDVKVSYDQEYASLSPGIFLMHQVLTQLNELNIRTVISHGNREYKRNWASTYVKRYRVFIFNNTVRSKLSKFIKFKAPQILKNMRK